MGIEINRVTFNEEEYQAFRHKLEDNLSAFRQLLQQPDFGKGEASLGAELEMYVIDKQGRPLCVNQEILELSQDSQLTLELNRYNLEYNLSPYKLSENAFQSTEDEILKKLAAVRKLAEAFEGRIVPIGILPTLQTCDFGPKSMTDRKRYHLLVKQLVERRGSQFQININGAHPLKMPMDDVTLEGANTSFQIHYRINPDDYIDMFNTIQLVSPLVVALAANSPTLFGHSLWMETRIPLFKQSIDTRVKHRYEWHEPARVNFGHGWLRKDPLEAFTNTVRLYSPMLPICGEEDPLATLKHGGVPRLEEMRLHQSSVWLWNRPIYDDADGGHLRIEMRALPAGPTPIDMVANAAFYIGLAEGIKPFINDLIPGLTFHLSEYNFYRAAQHGLKANIIWPEAGQSGCKARPILDVIKNLLPLARAGLQHIGIQQPEIDRYLTVIENRVKTQQTGAFWQLKKIWELEQKVGREEAMRQMLEIYLENSMSNQPVSEWN